MEDEQGKPGFTLGPATHTPVVLVVEYADGQTRRYRVSQGWQIEKIGGVSCLVLGRGAPCTYIPLSGVLSFDLVLAESGD